MDRICGYVAVGRTTKRLALRTLNSFINLLLIYNSFMILTRRGEGGGCLKQLLKASTCAALFLSYSFFSCTLYVPPPPPCYSILFRHFSSEYFFPYFSLPYKRIRNWNRRCHRWIDERLGRKLLCNYKKRFSTWIIRQLHWKRSYQYCKLHCKIMYVRDPLQQ